VFLEESSDLLENKRVEILVGAKRGKRVWKYQEVKKIDRKTLVCRFEGWNV
jgi:hypothetical protein